MRPMRVSCLGQILTLRVPPLLRLPTAAWNCEARERNEALEHIRPGQRVPNAAWDCIEERASGCRHCGLARRAYYTA